MLSLTKSANNPKISAYQKLLTMKQLTLTSFLQNLRNYLNENPEHNQIVNTICWLVALAGVCSVQDKAEAYEIKDFLDEIRPTIKDHSETEFFMQEINQIYNLLDVVLEETHQHSDNLLKTRAPGKLSAELRRISDCLARQKAGEKVPC